MDLENRLRDIRQDRGLTQESLAQAAGVTRQTIIAVEQGKFRPSVELALRIAKELDTSVHEIFWLKGDQPG
jgi:putative transcriptional regulator